MKPCLTRSSSWTISGRSSDSAYENVVNQKPGRSSSVIAAPPTKGRRSRTRVLSPALARYAPLVSPLCPAPTTIASKVRSASCSRVLVRSPPVEPVAAPLDVELPFDFAMVRPSPLRVVVGQPCGVRGDVDVAVVDRDLEVDATAGRGRGHRDAADADVPLEHGRVEEARREADLGPLVVVQEHLLLHRRVVHRRDQAALLVEPVPVAPVDDEPRRPEPRRAVRHLTQDGLTADEAAVVGVDATQHPGEAELVGRGSIRIRPRVAR